MKKTLLASLIAVVSFNAVAGDDPVNCRTQSASVDLYGGETASCQADNSGSDPYLSEYVPEQEQDSKVITSYDYGTPTSCSAPLTYSRTVSQTMQVCDYTPLAKYTVIHLYYPIAQSTYTSTSTDRDGTIVKTEWIADGVVAGQDTTYGFVTEWGLGPDSLKLRVTDNDGYTDTKVIF